MRVDLEEKLKKFTTNEAKAKAAHIVFKSNGTVISDFQYKGLQLVYGLAERCKQDGIDLGPIKMETADIPGRKYRSDITIEKHKIVIEFDSSLHNTELDLEKREAYKQSGYRILNVRSSALPPIKDRDVIVTPNDRFPNYVQKKLLSKLYAILDLDVYSLNEVKNATHSNLDLFITNYWYHNDREYFTEKLLPYVA